MTYFSKLFARFSKTPKTPTATPAPAPVAEPMAPSTELVDPPAIDGD